MADITIVNGVYKPTYNWGAPSCLFVLFIQKPRPRGNEADYLEIKECPCGKRRKRQIFS